MSLHPHADGFPCGWQCPAGGGSATPDASTDTRASVDVLLDGTPLTCSSEFNRGYDAGYLEGMKVPVVKVPRWDEDPAVITQGWNTPDRCGKCGEPKRPDAPETPHAPATAPNTTPRGSADAADGSEALRVRLADAALHAKVPTAPPWGELDEYVHDVWLGVVEGVTEEALAYGREQATQALRDAAGMPELDVPPELGEWWAGFQACARQARAGLEARAYDLGRQA